MHPPPSLAHMKARPPLAPAFGGPQPPPLGGSRPPLAPGLGGVPQPLPVAHSVPPRLVLPPQVSEPFAPPVIKAPPLITLPVASTAALSSSVPPSLSREPQAEEDDEYDPFSTEPRQPALRDPYKAMGEVDMLLLGEHTGFFDEWSRRRRSFEATASLDTGGLGSRADAFASMGVGA